MALFKQSYRDNLLQLKKEIHKKTQESIAVYDPFKQFVFDISHELYELTLADLYKKYHKTYSIQYNTIIKQHINACTSLIELMPSFFTDTNPTINDDFLTVYY